MRDQRHPNALPRAPNEGANAAGLRAVPRQGVGGDGVRCTTPGCGRKLAETLAGTLTIRCDRCRHLVTITG